MARKSLFSCCPSQGSSAGMTAWGGTCTNVPAASNCIVTMTATKVDSATFENPSAAPPPPRLSAERVVRPGHPEIAVYVQIYGAGTVLSQKIGNIGARTCDAGRRPAGSPVLQLRRPKGPRDRTEGVRVHRRRRFLGWSGPCGGTGTCTVQGPQHPGHRLREVRLTYPGSSVRLLCPAVRPSGFSWNPCT